MSASAPEELATLGSLYPSPWILRACFPKVLASLADSCEFASRVFPSNRVEWLFLERAWGGSGGVSFLWNPREWAGLQVTSKRGSHLCP